MAIFLLNYFMFYIIFTFIKDQNNIFLLFLFPIVYRQGLNT